MLDNSGECLRSGFCSKHGDACCTRCKTSSIKPNISAFGFICDQPVDVRLCFGLESHVKGLVLCFFPSGQNCLHLASLHGFLSLVENMVDLGADIDAKVSKVHPLHSKWTILELVLVLFSYILCSDGGFFFVCVYRSSTTVVERCIWPWTNRISLWSNSC